MSHPLNSIIDLAMRQAEADGAFENLPGAGKPLANLREPADAVLDRLMKEAHVKPPVVVLNQQICASRKHLATLTESNERKVEMKRLADLQTRLAIEQEAMRRFG